MKTRKYLGYALNLSLGLSSSVAAKPWKSGEILSHEKFRYGAFEAKMKASQGSGAISCFYLLKDGSWDPGQEWQEIDFEAFGKAGATSYQTQIMTPGDPRTQNNVFHSVSKPLSQDFHVYRMEWAPDSISFYFDGRLVRRETNRETFAKFFNPQRVEEMRLRLSLWVGFSTWSGLVDPSALPSPLFVDWVKYFAYEEVTGRFNFVWQDDFDSFDWSRWYKADWTFEYAVNDFKPQQVEVRDGQLRINFMAQ